jgi:hypothetical protein
MTEATPRPWRAHSGIIVSDTPNGEYKTSAVAYVGEEFRHCAGLPSGDERDANAALIARAVNSFEALVSALREAERFLDYFAEGRTAFVGPGTPKSCLAQVRAALAKAEEVAR